MSLVTRDKRMREVCVVEGAEFLSGWSGSTHNHPIMFAANYGGGNRIYVVSRMGRQFFEMDELADAIAAYCEALNHCGYEPPAVRLTKPQADQR
jgi:hypothetical protein